MTICPIAIAVGCKKCPVFSVCPATRILGDQPAAAPPAPAADEAPKKSSGGKRGRGHTNAQRTRSKGGKRPRKA
ncbi:hypothetical protein C7S18_16410 [Ahniella affigens]|uniref:Uncharacterized protein n=1 Tax=Ahniella affigens TaxID=2021234 RepID=A0A2P1PV21_9GAMM|nr:hypothetical protein [Ahniella affigens]AVP98672.1 hypothetical protein C7S18_16410 [Ahniella affigens]